MTVLTVLTIFPVLPVLTVLTVYPQVPQTSYRLMPDLGSRLRLAVMDLLPAAWVHSYILRRYAVSISTPHTHCALCSLCCLSLSVSKPSEIVGVDV